MSHRCLTESRKANEADFYFAALKYGHYLWLKGHAGRSILAVTRALYANLSGGAPMLDQWPLPYTALRWIVAKHPSDDFPGNPRISFQHQATRLRGERQALRRIRAWAVWALPSCACGAAARLGQRFIKDREASAWQSLAVRKGAR